MELRLPREEMLRRKPVYPSRESWAVRMAAAVSHSTKINR